MIAFKVIHYKFVTINQNTSQRLNNTYLHDSISIIVPT